MNASTMAHSPVALIYLMVGAFVFLLGIVILREAPSERANRATALMLFAGGMGSVLGAIGFLLGTSPNAPTGATNDLLRSFNYLWELFFPSLLYFACVFPQENKLFRKLPFASLLIFLPHVFHLLFTVLLSQGALLGKGIALIAKNSIGRGVVAGLRLPVELIIQFHQILFSLVNLFYIAAALTILFLSYRAATNGRIRSQVRTIFIGLASCAGLYAAAVPLPTLINHPWSAVTRSSLI